MKQLVLPIKDSNILHEVEDTLLPCSDIDLIVCSNLSSKTTFKVKVDSSVVIDFYI